MFSKEVNDLSVVKLIAVHVSR